MAAEKEFENKVKDYLESHRSWFIKYWAGSKFTKEGIPDLLICYDGKFVGAELKGPIGRPKILQLVNLRKIREAGGIGVLLYPENFRDFKILLEKGNPHWYTENIKEQQEWFKKLNK